MIEDVVLVCIKGFCDEFVSMFKIKNFYEDLEPTIENKRFIFNHRYPILFLISAKNAIDNGGTRTIEEYRDFYKDWFTDFCGLIVTYEDYVDNPMRVIKSVCKFIKMRDMPEIVKWRYNLQPGSVMIYYKIKVPRPGIKRIVILGNGPSLTKKALKRIKKDSLTIGCNWISKIHEPDYLAISDKEIIFNPKFNLNLPNTQYCVTHNVYDINPGLFKPDTQSMTMINMDIYEFLQQEISFPVCVRTNNTISNICVPLSINLALRLGGLPIYFIGVDLKEELGYFYDKDKKPLISEDLINYIKVYHYVYGNMYNSSPFSRLHEFMKFKQI